MKRPLPVAVGLGLLCAALSGGCVSGLKSNARPEQVYYLRAPALEATPSEGSAPSADAASNHAAGEPRQRIGASLRVSHPLAAPGLESSHIMLVQADHRMNFYTGSRWPAPIADVVEALAVETLRGSGVWSSVEDSTSPFPSDYLLQLTVRRFEADYTAKGVAPEVHVTLDCILGRREGRQVIASFVAAGSAPAAANRLSEVVSAFEQALGTALGALSQQAAQAVSSAQGAAQNVERPAPSISRASQ